MISQNHEHFRLLNIETEIFPLEPNKITRHLLSRTIDLIQSPGDNLFKKIIFQILKLFQIHKKKYFEILQPNYNPLKLTLSWVWNSLIKNIWLIPKPMLLKKHPFRMRREQTLGLKQIKECKLPWIRKIMIKRYYNLIKIHKMHF